MPWSTAGIFSSLIDTDTTTAYTAAMNTEYSQRQREDRLIQRALRILERRVIGTNPFDSPQSVKNYLCLRAAGVEHEEFTVMFLDSQHRLIATESLFRGTLAQTSVYPREVVKRALYHNAGAVVLSHNHPSGSPEPSRADEYLTQTLKTALQLVDVRVLDHVVVGGAATVSLAERGLI